MRVNGESTTSQASHAQHNSYSQTKHNQHSNPDDDDDLDDDDDRLANGESDSNDTDTSSTTQPPPRPQSLSSAVLAIDPSQIEIVTVNPYLNQTTAEQLLQLQQQQSSTSSSSSLLPSNIPFVGMFRGSANYIANHRNTLAVYHIPGGILEDDAGFRNLMNDISLTWLLGMKVTLVVGCRHQIEKRLRALQQQPDQDSSSKNQRNKTDNDDGYDHDDLLEVNYHSQLLGGVHGTLRVTNEETLRIVKEEAGYVRFEIERQLARSLRIQGGTGEKTTGDNNNGNYDGNVVSGNFYSAQPFGVRDGVDYKYVS
jgi:hypothetical protein